MGVMPLVLETKIADASKQSISGNHWLGEPRGQCLKLRPYLNFLPLFWSRLQDTYFQYILRLQTIFLFFHIFTCRANTLSPGWLPERILSLSHIYQQPSNTTKCISHTNILFHIYFVGETFSSHENSNCTEPQKETNI